MALDWQAQHVVPALNDTVRAEKACQVEARMLGDVNGDMDEMIILEELKQRFVS